MPMGDDMGKQEIRGNDGVCVPVQLNGISRHCFYSERKCSLIVRYGTMGWESVLGFRTDSSCKHGPWRTCLYKVGGKMPFSSKHRGMLQSEME